MWDRQLWASCHSHTAPRGTQGRRPHASFYRRQPGSRRHKPQGIKEEVDARLPPSSWVKTTCLVGNEVIELIRAGQGLLVLGRSDATVALAIGICREKTSCSAGHPQPPSDRTPGGLRAPREGGPQGQMCGSWGPCGGQHKQGSECEKSRERKQPCGRVRDAFPMGTRLLERILRRRCGGRRKTFYFLKEADSAAKKKKKERKSKMLSSVKLLMAFNKC